MEEDPFPPLTKKRGSRKRGIYEVGDKMVSLIPFQAIPRALKVTKDILWMPAMDVDYWDDVDDVMGTEFGSAAEAVMAFKEYAKLRMFEPMKQSETRLGCRWRGCPFGLEFDGPDLREIIREWSTCSHSHRDEPGRGLVSQSLAVELGLGEQGEKRKKIRNTSKPTVEIASFVIFSLKCGRFDDPWEMRAEWLRLHSDKDDDGHGAGHGTTSKKLPGMGGNAGPLYSSSGKYHPESGSTTTDIPGFPWYAGKHGARAIDRFRRAHFERGAASILLCKETVVRTETMTLDEMARELSPGDALYLKWWAASAIDTSLRFLLVAGTNAFSLQRTLMMLQFTHGVFNRAGSGAPFRNTPEYRSGNIREKRWERHRDGAARHAVFLPRDSNLVETRCYLAIDAHALESVRLESLMYIPLHMRMPTAPLLVRAWTRSFGTVVSNLPFDLLQRHRHHEEQLQQQQQQERQDRQQSVVSRDSGPVFFEECEVRLHAMSATLNFFVQHMTQAHDSTMRWVYPIWSPAFALYDMLPEFLTLVRGHRDSHIMSLLRESVLDGAHAEQHDSMGQTILAFILQKQQHILTRRMYNMIRAAFDKSYDVRVAHPIVAALLKYYKQHPTVAQLNQENAWVDFFLPGWHVLELDSVHEKLRPRLPIEECRPHHFFYLLCFDKENFTEHMRDDLARSFSLDDYSARDDRNVLHRPSFNFSSNLLTADQMYTPQFRDYMKHCAIPVPSHPGNGNVNAFFSTDVRDALPIGNLYTVMSTLQHLSWNPPTPYSSVKSNPNLVHREMIPLSSRDPRLDSDNLISVVRIGNLVELVTGQDSYDMPVARTEYFCPTPEVPNRRPFPRKPATRSREEEWHLRRQPKSQAESKGQAAPTSQTDSKSRAGPNIQAKPPKKKPKKKPKPVRISTTKMEGTGMAHRKPLYAATEDEEVLYMSEWLLSFPLKKRPSEAEVGLAELDAFLLVRDPAYFEYARAAGTVFVPQSKQKTRVSANRAAAAME